MSVEKKKVVHRNEKRNMKTSKVDIVSKVLRQIQSLTKRTQKSQIISSQAFTKSMGAMSYSLRSNQARQRRKRNTRKAKRRSQNETHLRLQASLRQTTQSTRERKSRLQMRRKRKSLAVHLRALQVRRLLQIPIRRRQRSSNFN